MGRAILGGNMSGEITAILSKTRLKQWHWGKILMLWIVVPAVGMGVGVGVGSGSFFVFNSDDLALGSILFLSATSIIVMLVITWVWLTGKESRR